MSGFRSTCVSSVSRKTVEDENAIAVYLDDKKVNQHGMKIGYLPRAVAKVFAEPMDSGYVELPNGKLYELDSDAGQGHIAVRVKKRVHRG